MENRSSSTIRAITSLMTIGPAPGAGTSALYSNTGRSNEGLLEQFAPVRETRRRRRGFAGVRGLEHLVCAASFLGLGQGAKAHGQSLQNTCGLSARDRSNPLLPD